LCHSVTVSNEIVSEVSLSREKNVTGVPAGWQNGLGQWCTTSF